MRIREHGLDEIALNVRGARKPKVVPAAMLPVPAVAGIVGASVVDLVLPKFQLFANIGIERGGERSGDRSVLRIVFGVFAEEIIAVAGETRIEASCSQAAAALQLF